LSVWSFFLFHITSLWPQSTGVFPAQFLSGHRVYSPPCSFVSESIGDTQSNCPPPPTRHPPCIRPVAKRNQFFCSDCSGDFLSFSLPMTLTSDSATSFSSEDAGPPSSQNALCSPDQSLAASTSFNSPNTPSESSLHHVTQVHTLLLFLALFFFF